MKRLEKEVKQLQKEYNNISCELFSKKMKLQDMKRIKYLNKLKEDEEKEKVCVLLSESNGALLCKRIITMPNIWKGVKKVFVQDFNWKNNVFTILEMKSGEKRRLEGAEHKAVVQFIRELEKVGGEKVYQEIDESLDNLEIIIQFDYVDC